MPVEQKPNPCWKISIAFILGAISGGLLVDHLKKDMPEVEDQTHSKPFSYIPSTVSPGAKDYLKDTVPIGGEKTSMQDWINARTGFASCTLSDSNKAKDRFVDTIEEGIIAGVSVTTVTPKSYTGEKALIYVHGGGYTLGATNHLYQIFAPVAYHSNLKAFSIDYRLAPEHPFPSGLEDCEAVYKELLKTYRAENLYFLGDSAGGALVVATLTIFQFLSTYS